MDYWTLSRLAREYYKVQIVTVPQLANWEISIDRGLTWTPMSYDTNTNTVSVLVSGPDFVPPPGDITQSLALTTSVMPYIRAVDNPEVLVRSTPRIDLV
jgi:hypothetical protein